MGKRRNERAWTYRIFEIARLLRIRRWTAQELAERLEVSKRSVLRDLEALLNDFGAPLVRDAQHHTYRLEGDFDLPLPELSEGEMISLFLIEQLRGQLEGTPYAASLASAGHKLRRMLTKHVDADEPVGSEFISIPREPIRGDELKLAANFGAMEQARRSRNTVEFKHYSVVYRETRRRSLDPYILFLRSGAWYVAGFCHHHRSCRMYALDRISDIKVTGARFIPPDSFELEEFLRHSWDLDRGEAINVRVRFDSHQARWIRERNWHATQSITDEEDGGLLYEVTVNGTREIKEWILGFGKHAEVLEPEALREEVAREVREMGEMYGGQL